MPHLIKKHNLFGDVFKGEGFASKIGYPTINILNASNTKPYLYIIKEKDYGDGCAFVTPDVAEIHFFKEVNCEKQFLSCNIISEITRPSKSQYANYIGVFDIFIMGLDQLNKIK